MRLLNGGYHGIVSRASDTIERSGENFRAAGPARVLHCAAHRPRPRHPRAQASALPLRVADPHGNACRDYRDRRVPG